MFHICNDERPSKTLAKSQVQAEGSHAIGRNGRLIGCTQGGPVEEEVCLQWEGGITLTSAPVSTRKRKLLAQSVKNKYFELKKKLRRTFPEVITLGEASAHEFQPNI